MRPGSIYWLNFSEWDDCLLVARQILTRAAPEVRGTFISTNAAAWVQDMLLQSASVHDVRAFKFIEGSMAALIALPTDLDRSLRPRQRAIMLLVPQIGLESVSQADLHKLLKTWQDWLEQQDCAMLVLHHSPESEKLTQQLIPNNDLIAGLALIQRESIDRLNYFCPFWRSALGVSASRNFTLEQVSDSLRVVGTRSTPDTHATSTTQSRCIIERAALAGFTHAQEKNWEIHDSAESVYRIARTQTDATIVFALRTYADIPDLARTLHALRLERGPALKLVVRELFSQLRLTDEEKLMDCGATMVIDRNVSYTRFRSILQNIKTVRYTRELTGSPDSLFETSPEQTPQGIVTPARFINHVQNVLAGHAKHEPPGVLVQLRPVPGLSVSQTLTQLNLRRFEDMACGLGQEMYLFLHGCLPSIVSVVLGQLFRLPYAEIFTSHTIFDEEQGIRSALSKMQERLETTGTPAEVLTDADEKTKKIIHETPLNAQGQGSFQPRRVKLLLQ